MQQQNTETNKTRLLRGLRVILMLIWAIATFWTFSVVMTAAKTPEELEVGTLQVVVACIMLAFNAYSLFRVGKRIWDES